VTPGETLDVILLFRDALCGTLFVAAGCAVLGVYVVYRRIVFVAAALAQLSSAGIALAMFVAGTAVHLGPLGSERVFSFAATLGGVAWFALEGPRYRVPPDSRLGLAYVVAGAAAVLLIARTAGADAHTLLLRGNILGITRPEMLVLGGVVGAVLVIHRLFHKEFIFVSFDDEMAATLGYRVRRWTLVLYATIGTVIAVAMHSAGVLLTFSYLVLPAVTGVLLARRLAGVFAWSIASSLVATAVGFTASIPLDLPTGPAIVAVSGAIAAAAWLFRRLRTAA
jgi:ABC-type Mn2+/Zn2+ transport system permease subunit